jgi:hypothetical protein
MRIKGDGKVGIGTANPNSKLHINPNTTSTVSPNTTGVYVYNENTGDATCTLRVNGENGGDPYISFDAAGHAGWSLGMDNSDGNKMKLAYSWSSLATNTRLSIDTSGQVGIGTNNPTQKLDVNGNVNINGTISYNTKQDTYSEYGILNYTNANTR